jgi:hypothetical protein
MNAKFGWCAGISCLLTTLMATSTPGIITGNIISTQLMRLYAAIPSAFCTEECGGRQGPSMPGISARGQMPTGAVPPSRRTDSSDI